MNAKNVLLYRIETIKEITDYRIRWFRNNTKYNIRSVVYIYRTWTFHSGRIEFLSMVLFSSISFILFFLLFFWIYDNRMALITDNDMINVLLLVVRRRPHEDERVPSCMDCGFSIGMGWMNARARNYFKRSVPYAVPPIYAHPTEQELTLAFFTQ